MRLAVPLALAALITACERKPEEPIAVPEAPAAAAEVAAADSYGAPGAGVADVAFWSHPSVAFESLLIAATAEKVTAYAIETGAAAFEIPGGAGEIEVFYAGEGAVAKGYILTASDEAYRLYTIHKDGRGFDPVALANAGSPAKVICAGGGAAPAIYEAAGGKLSARSLAIVARGAELGGPRAIADIEAAIGCDVDPLTDEIVTVSGDGAIRRVDPASGAVLGIALPQDLAPSASSLAVSRSEGGEAQGQVALLDGASGAVSLFDAKDGHALGSIRVKATFDLAAVESASRIVAGSANYGGVYRDGALAVVTSGGGAPVRLVPWNGVMGALSLPVGAAIDPRAPAGAAPEDAVISIELIEP